MKHIFTYLFISAFFISYSFAQTLELKDREMFSKHNVKVRTKLDYNFKGNIPSLEGKVTAKSYYDKNGRVLAAYSFNLKGDTVTFDKYEYDKNGNRVLYQRKSLHGEYKKESEYNSVNNLIEEEGFDGGATFQTIFKYDDQNRVLNITYFTADEIDEKRVYKYNGNKATVEILKLGKHLTSKMELLFNNNRQILEEKLLSLDGKVLEKKTFEYNSKGDIVKEEKYKNNALFYQLIFDYDSNGDLLSITEDAPSKDKFIKKKFGYDNLGRITEYHWKRRPDDEYNIKNFKYEDDGVCSEEHTYYPRTNYKLLTRYEYEFF
jgi:hypothetical protein